MVIHPDRGYGPERRLYVWVGSLPLAALGDMSGYVLAVLTVLWMAPVCGSRVLGFLRDLDAYRTSRRR